MNEELKLQNRLKLLLRLLPLKKLHLLKAQNNLCKSKIKEDTADFWMYPLFLYTVI